MMLSLHWLFCEQRWKVVVGALRTIMSYLSNSGVTSAVRRGADNLIFTIKKIQIFIINVTVITEVAFKKIPSIIIVKILRI